MISILKIAFIFTCFVNFVISADLNRKPELSTNDFVDNKNIINNYSPGFDVYLKNQPTFDLVDNSQFKPMEEIVLSYLNKNERFDYLVDKFVNFNDHFNIFKNNIELFEYWKDLINSKDFIKNQNMIKYAYKINTIYFLTNQQILNLLSISNENFLFDSFKLFLQVEQLTDELQDISQHLFDLKPFFNNEPFNDHEKTSQLKIVKLMLKTNPKTTKNYLKSNFYSVIKSFNLLLVEFIVNKDVINVNEFDGDDLVEDELNNPNWFNAIWVLFNIKEDSKTHLHIDYLVKVFKVCLSKVINVNQKDKMGRNIKAFIKRYINNDPRILLSLIEGNLINIRKRSRAKISTRKLH